MSSKNHPNLLDNVLNYFEGTPVLNLVSLIIAVLGISLSIYFYIKSKKSRKPTYTIRTINLIKDQLQKIEAVKILFQDRVINNLSISKIALWNDGKETIDFSDLALVDPLKCTIDGDYEILDAKIVFQKNNANDFKIEISPDKKSILIEFDFFDFEEGVIIQISHTGLSSSNISINGTVKSVKSINRKQKLNILPKGAFDFFYKNKSKNEFLRSLSVPIIISGIIVLTSNFLPDRYNYVGAMDHKFYTFIYPWFGIPYILFGFYCLKRQIPKGFDIFNEEL